MRKPKVHRRYVVKHLPSIQRAGDLTHRAKLDCGHVHNSLRPIMLHTVYCVECALAP